MKRKYKGGQSLPAKTDPRSHHYSDLLANGFVSETMQKCETGHFGDDLADNRFGVSVYLGANTDTPDHATTLEKCLVDKLYDGLPAASRPIGLKEDIVSSVPTRSSLPFPEAGKCSIDVDGVPHRVECSTLGPNYDPASYKVPDADIKSYSQILAKLKGYDKDGRLPQGGSRKRKSRSPPSLIKNAKHNRMARKSTRRATRRSASRKTSRKGSRKTRRSCRK